ncbi:MAG: carboxypeptidase-like regulatory domain-containing protein [Planctomycetota bacterium]
MFRPGEAIEEIDVILEPFGTITGIVRDSAARAPIPGAAVFVGDELRRSKRDLGMDVRQATTREDGTFTIASLRPGLVKVAAMHPDYGVGMKEGVSQRVNRCTQAGKRGCHYPDPPPR